MLNALFLAFKQEFGLANVASITSYMSYVIALLESEYVKDGNAKNAAIDALCQLLQVHKTTVIQPVVEPIQPTVENDTSVKS